MIWINNSVNDFFVSDTSTRKVLDNIENTIIELLKLNSKLPKKTTQEKNVELLKANPSLTRKDLAIVLNVSEDGRNIRSFIIYS